MAEVQFIRHPGQQAKSLPAEVHPLGDQSGSAVDL